MLADKPFPGGNGLFMSKVFKLAKVVNKSKNCGEELVWIIMLSCSEI